MLFEIVLVGMGERGNRIGSLEMEYQSLKREAPKEVKGGE